MMNKLIDGVNTAIPNEEKKEIVAAVLAVAYSDGSIDSRALLNDGKIEWQMNVVPKLIEASVFALNSCLSCVPTGLKKLAKEIS